jgi:hypothetical protein
LFIILYQPFFSFSAQTPVSVLKTAFFDSAGNHKAHKYNKDISAYLAKGNFVTKMQIIAKAIITFLGISAFVNVSQNFTMMTTLTLARDISIFRIILFSIFVIILLIAIVYWLIFKNDWLACRIAGSDEKLSPQSETIWLVSSLRIVAVLYGLILLPGSITTILNVLALPLYIRPWVNEIFTFKTFPKSLVVHQWSNIIYYFLQTILAVYLLYGWPQFIRFQLNIQKTRIQKELKNE